MKKPRISRRAAADAAVLGIVAIMLFLLPAFGVGDPPGGKAIALYAVIFFCMKWRERNRRPNWKETQCAKDEKEYPDDETDFDVRF